MIALLLNEVPFEQDIREIFMAFYPGQEFIHEPCKEAMIVFSAEPDKEKKSYLAQICFNESGDRFEFQSGIYPERLNTKTEIKRNIYRILSNVLKRELPWGTLTGIRPSKIAMELLESGMEADEVYEELKKVYLAGDKKARLCTETAVREREILSEIDYINGWSLYIGIPFCPGTCLYCSFTSYPISAWRDRTDTYVDALCRELKETAGLMKDKKLQSIYMGGGTPTSLSAGQLDRILGTVREIFDLSYLKELTVEAGRPDSIDTDKLEVLRKHGVGRISINPQTMKESTLKLIGRHHSVDMVRSAFMKARELGFDNINMDLIVGLPEEGPDDIRYTMQEIAKLAPDSVTVHSLAIKRAARLNTSRENYKGLHMESTEEMIDLTSAACREMGLNPYYMYRQKNMSGNFENVGYAKAGKECIYNILIMEEKQSIAGCGAGTSSKIVYPGERRLERTENVKDPMLYIERLDDMIARKKKLLAK